MSGTIIEVRGLSKCYTLGKIGFSSLKEDAQRLFAFGRKKVSGESEGGRREFWALRDVSFEVKAGQVLGIIGKNGAGKSTLLKILSRITEPSAGEALIKGRVASLLEVGTGFHGDLSGRENIYLNGAILGMTRAEVRRKFDEIVEFAEVGKFIDTPVKRYSSGMYVRLAFAVAAHLEPEILIVDEVLAVGDQQFQKKCLGKMQEISSGHGRTILFVSHNFNAVESLCDSAIVLDGGRVADSGSNVSEMIRSYLSKMSGNVAAAEWRRNEGDYENEHFVVETFGVYENNRPVTAPVSNSSSLSVKIRGKMLDYRTDLQVGYGLFTSDNQLVYWSTNLDSPETNHYGGGGCGVCYEANIPPRFLNEGGYRVDLFLGLYHRRWISEPGVNAPSVRFEIQGGLSDSEYWIERRPGVLAPVFTWEVTTR